METESNHYDVIRSLSNVSHADDVQTQRIHVTVSIPELNMKVNQSTLHLSITPANEIGIPFPWEFHLNGSLWAFCIVRDREWEWQLLHGNGTKWE